MSVVIETKPVPLRADNFGVLRVADTRVSLDSIIAAFNEGATPEEIVQQYDAVSLADVYAVIGYYLDNQDEIDAYLAKRSEQREQMRREIESRHSPAGIRRRLLARRKK
jgi:uncharacterized protein (DUF433 family)